MKITDVLRRKTSRQSAKDRLRFVLLSDRQTCSPEIMEHIKNDILEVLSKYVEVDQEGLDIKFTQTEDEGNEALPTLYANIPIRNMKHVIKD